MNCKQGDMAIVTRSAANNEGRTVTCLEFVGELGIVEIKGSKLWLPGTDYWRVDQDLNLYTSQGMFRDFAPYVRDSRLMPISGYKEPTTVREEESEPA